MREGQLETVDLPVIRQSFRCFWFAILGVIPGLGVALAWQALQLSKNIAAASGEKTSSSFAVALLLVALAFTPILFVAVPWPVLMISTLLLCSIFIGWSLRRFSVETPARWNPARSWAWAGATLARLGIGLTILAFELALTAAYYERLLGTR